MTTMTEPTTSPAAADEGTEQHPLRVSVAYHLLPGLLILAATAAALPLVTAAGLPPLLALMAAFLVVGLPVQLGHLLYRGRRRNGRLSLAGVVLYRRRIPRWQYPLLVLAILVWCYTFLYLLQPVGTALEKTIFAWVPAGFTATNVDDAASLTAYPRPVLLLTFGALLLINGLLGPIVEELYFRGYLLPRLSRLGWKAPLLQTLLFAAYHFWQPWLYPTILVSLAALVFPVYRTRNIYIGIWAHCLLNIIGAMAIFALILGGTA